MKEFGKGIIPGGEHMGDALRGQRPSLPPEAFSPLSGQTSGKELMRVDSTLLGTSPEKTSSEPAQKEAIHHVPSPKNTHESPIVTGEVVDHPVFLADTDSGDNAGHTTETVSSFVIKDAMEDPTQGSSDQKFGFPHLPYKNEIEKNEDEEKPTVVVEVNKFKTRGEPLPLDIDGKTEEWHSVKGGLRESKRGIVQSKQGVYEILFNPQTSEWLKAIPEGNGKAEKHLRKSVIMARDALEVAGLPELAEQIRETNVVIRGKKHYGFISPHLGESVDHYGEASKEKGYNPKEVDELITAVYETAYDQAVQLYARHGHWMDDPNPGNILLHETPDGDLKVVLIDFANKIQHKSVSPEKIPDKIFPGDTKSAEVRRRHQENIQNLRDKFAKQCKIAGGSLSEALDPERYKDVITGIMKR